MSPKKMILPVVAALLLSTSIAHAESAAESKPAEKAATTVDTAPVVKKRAPLENMDRNQDGFVDLSEAEEFAGDQFNNMDDNKDGVVTTEEMDLFHHARRGKWAAKRDDAADQALAVSEEAQARIKAKAAERGQKHFGMLDTNGDGKVERAEFVSHALNRHKKLDGDGDSKVTKEEIRQSREKMQEARKERREQKRSDKGAADAPVDAPVDAPNRAGAAE